MSKLSAEQVDDLFVRFRGHRDGGEEEVFLGIDELEGLLDEVLDHRQRRCVCTRPHSDEPERTWGYDG